MLGGWAEQRVTLRATRLMWKNKAAICLLLRRPSYFWKKCQRFSPPRTLALTSTDHSPWNPHISNAFISSVYLLWRQALIENTVQYTLQKCKRCINENSWGTFFPPLQLLGWVSIPLKRSQKTTITPLHQNSMLISQGYQCRAVVQTLIITTFILLLALSRISNKV